MFSTAVSIRLTSTIVAACTVAGLTLACGKEDCLNAADCPGNQSCQRAQCEDDPTATSTDVNVVHGSNTFVVQSPISTVTADSVLVSLYSDSMMCARFGLAEVGTQLVTVGLLPVDGNQPLPSPGRYYFPVTGTPKHLSAVAVGRINPQGGFENVDVGHRRGFVQLDLITPERVTGRFSSTFETADGTQMTVGGAFDSATCR